MSARVALVHDWLTNQGGGERVLYDLHHAFPEAPIYTSVYRPEALPQFKSADVRTSFLQGWPMAKTKHQLFPALRTLAFESFDFSDYDLVISTGAAESKGIITKPRTTHISYLFTPTRYYWSEYDRYLKEPGFGALDPLVRLVMPRMVRSLRRWDYAAAQRPDEMVGISRFVADRIKRFYDRDAKVIYPPVSIERFEIRSKVEDFYLVVSRLIPYKKVELAVRACAELDLPLIVIGDGSEMGRLQKLGGPKTKFLGRLSDDQIADYYSRAKAFIFTAEEDFGITPLESMASGRPVLAYGVGGATETVVAGQTGEFFNEQTVGSLVELLKEFDPNKYDPKVCRQRAEEFSTERFIKEIKALV